MITPLSHQQGPMNSNPPLPPLKRDVTMCLVHHFITLGKVYFSCALAGRMPIVVNAVNTRVLE
jgi:hypothetical protein